MSIFNSINVRCVELIIVYRSSYSIQMHMLIVLIYRFKGCITSGAYPWIHYLQYLVIIVWTHFIRSELDQK